MTPSGARFREKRRAQAQHYMKTHAPAKYHDILIPSFEVGCKRRIFDSGYLDSLHSQNLTLTDESALKITEGGIETKLGPIEADASRLLDGREP
ncbi:hypothetical protein LB505_009941 [Fusarium chuoi]|nr:hypothetical protein LB505_009941 [Fusarium chuoi]